MALNQAQSNAPSSTLYVRNLEEKIKPEQLKDSLRTLFSQYGEVIDLVAKQNLKAKGQAFVVLDSEKAASRALEEIQGFELFQKPMVIDYARATSDATVKRQGTDQDLELHKRRRLAEKDRKQAAEAADNAKKTKPIIGSSDLGQARSTKTMKGAGLKSSNPGASGIIPEEYLPPNKTLFIQNLPDEYGVEELTTIFGHFEGFREVRLVPGRKGIAFVEYETEAGSISAKERTTGMNLGEDRKTIKIVYQRQ